MIAAYMVMFHLPDAPLKVACPVRGVADFLNPLPNTRLAAVVDRHPYAVKRAAEALFFFGCVFVVSHDNLLSVARREYGDLGFVFKDDLIQPCFLFDGHVGDFAEGINDGIQIRVALFQFLP